MDFTSKLGNIEEQPGMDKLTPEQRIQAWLEWMDFTEQFLLVGLNRKGMTKDGVRQALQQWYREDRDERDRERLRLAEVRRAG